MNPYQSPRSEEQPPEDYVGFWLAFAFYWVLSLAVCWLD